MRCSAWATSAVFAAASHAMRARSSRAWVSCCRAASSRFPTSANSWERSALACGMAVISLSDATLLDVLSFGSRLGQLLHVHLDLLRDLRLLLALVLKLCLNRGILRLSLIARLCRFAQSRTGRNDLGLQ